MLGFPDRLRDDVPAVDGNDALVQSQEDIAATLRKGKTRIITTMHELTAARSMPVASYLESF